MRRRGEKEVRRERERENEEKKKEKELERKKGREGGRDDDREAPSTTSNLTNSNPYLKQNTYSRSLRIGFQSSMKPDFTLQQAPHRPSNLISSCNESFGATYSLLRLGMVSYPSHVVFNPTKRQLTGRLIGVGVNYIFN